MSNVFEVGKAYTFQVHPSNIIENVFDHVVCIANLSGNSAARYIDIEAMHAQVYPYLPSGTPDSATMYNYAQFQLQDGSIVTIGIPWVNIDTIEVSDSQMIVVRIRGVTVNKVNDIRSALIANGFDNLEIIVQPNVPKDNTNIANRFYHP